MTAREPEDLGRKHRLHVGKSGSWGHPVHIHLSRAPWGLREFAVRALDGHVLRLCAEG